MPGSAQCVPRALRALCLLTPSLLLITLLTTAYWAGTEPHGGESSQRRWVPRSVLGHPGNGEGRRIRGHKRTLGVRKASAGGGAGEVSTASGGTVLEHLGRPWASEPSDTGGGASAAHVATASRHAHGSTPAARHASLGPGGVAKGVYRPPPPPAVMSPEEARAAAAAAAVGATVEPAPPPPPPLSPAAQPASSPSTKASTPTSASPAPVSQAAPQTSSPASPPPTHVDPSSPTPLPLPPSQQPVQPGPFDGLDVRFAVQPPPPAAAAAEPSEPPPADTPLAAAGQQDGGAAASMPQRRASLRKSPIINGITAAFIAGSLTANLAGSLTANLAARPPAPRPGPPPPPPAPQPSMQCPLASSPDGGAASGPGYHIVVLASPRVQQGRYLASTLLSIAAADARPTTTTVLWAAHRRQRTPPRPWAPSPPAAPHGGSPGGSGGPGNRSGVSDQGGDVESDNEEEDVEATLVQRVEMPPPAPGDPWVGQPVGGDADREGLNDFSLLENLAVYAEVPGGPAQHQRQKQQQAQKQEQRQWRKEGWEGGGGAMHLQPLPHLRVRYLPESVTEGDVMESYYYALGLPDQIAAEAGDPGLRELPLLILEGDVLLAPHFAARMACVLRLMRSLGDEGSGGYGGAPDFAMSLYGPGMIPQDVPDVMKLYDEATAPPGQQQATATPKRRWRMQQQQQQQQPDSDQAASAGAAASSARAEDKVDATEQAAAAAPTQSVAASDGASDGANGSEGGNGASRHGREESSAGGAAGAASASGAGASGAASPGAAGSGGSGPSTLVSLVPTLWSWGSQGLLYSYGVRVSLMHHYREILAGCAPQDGLQDIELVRHMELRGCVGVAPMPPVAAKPRITGSVCDPRVVHGNASSGAGGGSGKCYLFTTRPSMVQHVGASSTMFGSVSNRFHMSLEFPRRVSIPGLDPDKAW